ncbi:ABC transporter ATP-binding protein [Pelosinus sp. sgz500959]|uniref:ABC transporter ATP-binding protein n=1 Tax=Pelosinus sp. sgz500959 TaxID=3242472 RepID=UPI00366C7BFA
MSNLIELQNISKNYGKDSILSNLSLTVKKGTAVAIVGDSGGGKTTLLSIMGLLQNTTSGKIFIDNLDISSLSQQEQAKIRGNYFGFVFQRARLISSLTALENVMVPAWLTQKDKNLEKRAIELLTHFNLDHRLNHKPGELSLGQLRRVSLARALLLNPPILLADEPTNDLDPALAKSVADCLLEARDRGTSVVIITHDPVLAARTDEVFTLQNRQIYQVQH